MATYTIDNPPEWIKTGDVVTCAYSGTSKSIKLPIGKYQFDLWGAKGAGCGGLTFDTGANGGKTTAILHIDKETEIFLVCGEAGQDTVGNNTRRTFNGGGRGGTCGMTVLMISIYYYFGSGGGATHIALRDGELSSLENYKEDILAVAGGGGSKATPSTAGSYILDMQGNAYGGGTSGGTCAYNVKSGASVVVQFDKDSTPGTQTSPGTAAKLTFNGSTVVEGHDGAFGQGGDGYYDDGSIKNGSSGGGGGYYGGGGGSACWALQGLTVNNCAIGASGGSGYINKNLLLSGSVTDTEPSTSTNPDSDGNGYIKITCLSRDKYVELGYNNRIIASYYVDDTIPFPITYNNKTLLNQSVVMNTLNCMHKRMHTNITFGNKTALCNQKYMLSNITSTLNKTIVSADLSGVKTVYNYGDTFSLNDLNITANYINGTSDKITNFKSSIPAGKSLTHSDTSNTISFYDYGGNIFSKTYNLTINVATMSITASGMKTSYIRGSLLDTSGLTVKANLSNGTQKTVTNYTTVPANGTTVTDSLESVQVRYTDELGKTFTYDIPITVIAPLPSGYTRLEYVTATGAQYVALSLNFSSQFELVCDFSISSLYNGYMFGYNNVSGYTNYITGARMLSSGAIAMKGGTGSTSDTGGVIISTPSVTTGKQYTVSMEYVNSGTMVNYVLTPEGGTPSTGGKSVSGGFTTGNKSLYLLNYKAQTANGFRGNIYGFQGYVNNSTTPYIELVPCRRNSDNKVGFYDLKSSSFKSPTGTLTAGPVVS